MAATEERHLLRRSGGGFRADWVEDQLFEPWRISLGLRFGVPVVQLVAPVVAIPGLKVREMVQFRLPALKVAHPVLAGALDGQT